MTKAALKRAFRKFNSVEQADILRELAAELAGALAEADRADARIFARRRHEEPKARPWQRHSGALLPFATTLLRLHSLLPGGVQPFQLLA